MAKVKGVRGTKRPRRSRSDTLAESNDITQLEWGAEDLQRNYRGYRERRQLNGLGLDASTRWIDAIRELQYRNHTQPRSLGECCESQSTQTGGLPREDPKLAKRRWRDLRTITSHAHGDDMSDTEGLDEEQGDDVSLKKRREPNSKMMGLEYFLEMVDQQHRYGSHLRKYHGLWKEVDTRENFFWWLDHGEGLHIEAPGCTRLELDRDRVRYLSREERLQYLVTIDEEGRLRWAKNGERVTTSQDYKDSMEGIVRREELSLAYGQPDDKEDISSHSSDEDLAINRSQTRKNSSPHQNNSTQKVQTVHPAAFLDHLLSNTSSSKKAKWIFVADTSFRLYIGIKQSGAFQHSSFLCGARIFAAGQIKVINGQLRRLHPLSGHYRPPVANFRAFVKNLREKDVDLSRVSVSESWVVLLGTEGYMNTKRGLERKAQASWRWGRKGLETR